MAGNCRNNVADWRTRDVPAPPGTRGFAYYATKDQAMVDDAEYDEDYLFSADRFVSIDVPAAVKASLLKAS